MQLQRDLVARRLTERIGDEVEVMIDGRSPESELVVTGRLQGQAPDIDAMVYLDSCDPSAVRAGDLVRAIVTGASGYDLIARPVPLLAG